MKRLLLAAVLMAMALPLYGQGVSERVDLPTADQEQMFWATLVYDNSAEAKHLQTMLADPALRQLVADTHYRPRKATDTFYRTRLQANVGDAPLFMLQAPDGAVVYKCRAGNIPSNATSLRSAIKRALAKFRCKPKPEPAPDTPAPVVTPIIPDTEPEPKEPAGSWLASILTVVAGLGLGAGGGYISRNR